MSITDRLLLILIGIYIWDMYLKIEHRRSGGKYD